MKRLLRFIFCTFGVFMFMALIIYLCKPDAMPWYVQAIMIAASIISAIMMEDID